MGQRSWVVLAALSVAVVLGFGAYMMLADDSQPEGNTLVPSVRRDLADRVVQALEADPAAGRAILPVERRMCAARVFGAEPVRASTASEVETVYAWLYCVEVKVDRSTGTDTCLPIAVDLDGKPKVERPRDGAAYQGDVKKIFPARLHHVATKDKELYAADLRPEVERRLAGQTAPS